MTFKEKLVEVSRPKGLGLCVGLDPDPQRLPAPFAPDLQGIAEFLELVISATLPFASAYKLNTAFYEAWGSEGWGLLERIAHLLPVEKVRIADAKRGDIGNTARYYAKAFFERLPFDAVTLSPYMGRDSVEPFIEDPQKGAYVLALTTNVSSGDLQRFSDGRQKLYQLILRHIPSWAPLGNLGAVVGATHPEELKEIREKNPSLPLLIPGIGAQGGDEKSVAAIASRQGGPLLVNVSRGILYPQSELDFPQNIARACEDYLEALGILG